MNGLKGALDNIKEVLVLLNDRFNVITQTQFLNLFELVSAIKTKIEIKIKALIVKNLASVHVYNIIEEVFQEELKKVGIKLSTSI